MRDEAANWRRAPVLSGERESAGGRLVADVLKLDELLSSGAPLPPDWAPGRPPQSRRRLTEEAIIAAATAIDAEFRNDDGHSKPQWARDLAIIALEAALEQAPAITVPA
jgi:hypothetical protein